MGLYKFLMSFDPNLKDKLKIIRSKEKPEDYIKKTVFSTIYFSLAFGLIIFMFTKNPINFLWFIFFLPIFFFYFLKRVDVKIKKIEREISKEVVFATRFLIIELESGINLFEALKGVAQNYEAIGSYFKDIVDKIEFGTPMEEALKEAIEYSPSEDMRRVLWQILNSLTTGGNIADALRTIVDQIVREKQIMVKEYGRKLSPLAMFYMTATIILPTIGTLLLTVFAIFLGMKLTLSFFLAIAFFVAFIQIMFLQIITHSRPPVEI